MRPMDLVKEYLASEGYRYDIDSDGDLHFKIEGVNLYCTNNGNDEQFFRIIMPGIYEVENNRVKVLEACNKISRDYKVLKAFLVEDRLWLTVEMFMDSTPEVGDFIQRISSILINARKDIAQEILG